MFHRLLIWSAMKLSPRAALVGILSLVLPLAAASLASADWRDDVKVLRIGILAGDDAAYRIATLEPFRVYLQDRTGIPVEVVPAGSYEALIEAEASGAVQYAIYSATSYATAVARCGCVEAIAAPVAADGALGFYSILLARSGDSFGDLSDARGKRIALGGEDSVAGRLIPLHAFAAEDIDPDDFFASVVTVPGPEAGIAALLVGEVDLAAAWSSLTGTEAAGYDFGVLTKMVAEGSLAMDRVRVVWQSRLIPFGPHDVRTDIPPELKAILIRAMLGMATDDPEALDAVDRLAFGGGGFATPDPSLYALLMELVTPPASN
jgi:phosphonate transport system substrate-binding protein